MSSHRKPCYVCGKKEKKQSKKETGCSSAKGGKGDISCTLYLSFSSYNIFLSLCNLHSFFALQMVIWQHNTSSTASNATITIVIIIISAWTNQPELLLFSLLLFPLPNILKGKKRKKSCEVRFLVVVCLCVLYLFLLCG